MGGLTAGDVPGGILWLTPPDFPDVTAHPISDWSLWFTPASTAGGSLWTDARLWQTFPKGQTPRLLGVTDSYAIIHLAEGDQTRVVAVRLTDGSTRVVAQYAATAEAQRQGGLDLSLPGPRFMSAPSDVILSDENVVQPDILFITKERTGIIDWDGGVRGAPDLIIEILSPSTASIELLILGATGLDTARVFPTGSTLTSALLPTLSIQIGEIFAI